MYQLLAAYLSGLLSFLAPCLLPLFPTYLTVITGFTFAELYGLEYRSIRKRIITASVVFSLGFSLVFTLLGATGSIVGQLLGYYLPLLTRISGIFLIVLGLSQLGILHLDQFKFDFAWNIQKKLTKLGLITAFATGIAAAFSWIPCIGPLLTPILILAGNSDTVLSGALLLFIFSLGLTTPFLLAGFAFPQIAKNIESHKKFFHYLSIMSGILIILLGIVLVADWYTTLITLFRKAVF